MNPNGLVPVLRDGEITMFESNAIVRYLAARYGAGALRPLEPQALALAEQWMEWTHDHRRAACRHGVHAECPHAGGQARTRRRSPEAAEELKRCSADRRCALWRSRKFLAGDAADLRRHSARLLSWRLSQFDWPRPALANLERWFLSLQSRPAYRDWVMVPVGRNPGREWLANERSAR